MPFPGHVMTLTAQRIRKASRRHRSSSPAVVAAVTDTRWASALPTPGPGPMNVYVEWADAEIPETMVTLDATSITQSAPSAVTLWDPDE